MISILKKLQIRSLNSRLIIWLLSTFAAFCWSYALAVRFTRFFMASLVDKGFILGAFFLPIGFITVIIFHRYLPLVFQRIQPKRLAFICLASIVLTAFLLLIAFPPLNYPENHTLLIQPVADIDRKDVSVITIQRIELPGSRETVLAPAFLENNEKWKMSGDGYPLIWMGDPNAALTYSRFMQAGLEVVFKTGPEQGNVEISWGGRTSLINLEAPEPGMMNFHLLPTRYFSDLALNWKLLVGLGIITQWLGLFVFMVLIMQFPLVFTIRAPATIVLSLALFFLLVPLVNLVDPVANFKDPQLENAVRLAINKPDGYLRSHQLLTLAILDASTYEINDLSGIDQLRGLESLRLRNNNISSIDPLEKLTRLTELDLRGNQVRDISPIADLKQLERLNLRENPIEDIRPLKDLVNLRELNLHGVNVGSDISVISRLKNLTRLNIRRSEVSDLSPIESLMISGALQDDLRLGIRARVDIRDNPVSREIKDGYAGLRPFWGNISERAPFQLPEFAQLPPPVFSHQSGFYEADFPLEITAESSSAEVHFTLDCSEPTANSPLYQEPIFITENSGNCPALSSWESMSPQWQPPIGPVDRGVIVRAKVFSPDEAYSPVVTQTFFIGKEFEGKYSLPIVSLTTDPGNLKDDDYGIYTMGRVQENMGGLSGNYSLRGAEWERPAHFEYFDQNRQVQISQKIGFRIHGATTRNYAQKSLRLYASDIYDDGSVFENVFFENPNGQYTSASVQSFNKLLLRSSGNNRSFPFYRDNLLQKLVEHTSLDIHAFRPVNVFLNGEYWGIYNLREYLDEEFLATRYGLDPQKIVILENDGQLLVGNHGDEKQYQDVLEFIRKDVERDPKNLEYLHDLMDLENFMDYQIAQIYSRNENWPFDNIKYWRYKTDVTGSGMSEAGDGRWRWLLHDLDTAFGVIGGVNAAQENTLVKAEGEFLFRSLLEYDQFRIDFINRCADHLNTTFLPDRVINVIDEMNDEIVPDLPVHLNRWAILNGSLDAWDANVQIMRDFAAKRPGALRQHMLDRFDLPGTVELAILHDSSQGTVRINSIELTKNTAGVENPEHWTGVYFKGVPLQLNAAPKPGYEFAGWEGIEETSPSISLIPKEDLLIKAIFAPLLP